MDLTDVSVTLTLDEAVTVLAALKVAENAVTRTHADSVARKIERAVDPPRQTVEIRPESRGHGTAS